MSENKGYDQEGGRRPSFFKSMPKPQRTAFLLLSTLSLGVLILWVWQFNSALNRPFRTIGNSGESLDSFQEALTDMDTDGDGLKDREETSLHGTSPYLEDTDSDGLSDRQEIEQGTDPNCAAGTACETKIEVAAPAIPTSTVSLPENIQEGALEAMMSGQSGAAELRSLLLQSGVDPLALESLSDEELLAAYGQMLSEQGTTTQP
ncbi:MAG: hypothetical protein ACM3PZ_00915 [Bacillota bacterium]